MEVKLASRMQLRVESKTRSLAGVWTAAGMCSCDMGPCVWQTDCGVASGWQLSPVFLVMGGVLALCQITMISSLKNLTLKISLAYKHGSRSLGTTFKENLSYSGEFSLIFFFNYFFFSPKESNESLRVDLL